MNDKPLTPEHSFPLRMTTDGRYGFKGCKWLDKIEWVDYDYKGHICAILLAPDSHIRRSGRDLATRLCGAKPSRLSGNKRPSHVL